MKKLLLVVAGVILFCGIVFAEGGEKTQQGRYQIVNVRTDENEIVFLLDTETGKCWQASSEVIFDEDGKLLPYDLKFFKEIHIENLHETELHKGIERATNEYLQKKKK